MGVYDKIQKSLPVTKSELSLLIIVISGLIVANIYSAIFEENISESEKQEFVNHFDSLLIANNTPQKPQPITPIDIRTADKFQLMKIKGIGKKTALSILEYRRDNQFKSTSEIMNVKGISPITYEKLLPFLFQFGEKGSYQKKELKWSKKELPNKKIDINSASLNELIKFPGIGESTAKKIIDYRSVSPFKSIEEIKNIKGIGDKKFEKLKNFIEIDS